MLQQGDIVHINLCKVQRPPLRIQLSERGLLDLPNELLIDIVYGFAIEDLNAMAMSCQRLREVACMAYKKYSKHLDWLSSVTKLYQKFGANRARLQVQMFFCIFGDLIETINLNANHERTMMQLCIDNLRGIYLQNLWPKVENQLEHSGQLHTLILDTESFIGVSDCFFPKLRSLILRGRKHSSIAFLRRHPHLTKLSLEYFPGLEAAIYQLNDLQELTIYYYCGQLFEKYKLSRKNWMKLKKIRLSNTFSLPLQRLSSSGAITSLVHLELDVFAERDFIENLPYLSRFQQITHMGLILHPYTFIAWPQTDEFARELIRALPKLQRFSTDVLNFENAELYRDLAAICQERAQILHIICCKRMSFQCNSADRIQFEKDELSQRVVRVYVSYAS